VQHVTERFHQIDSYGEVTRFQRQEQMLIQDQSNYCQWLDEVILDVVEQIADSCEEVV
jgi:hypothetical protein